MAQIPNVKKKPSTLPVLPFPFQTVRENPKAVASPPATKVAELEAWEVTGEQAAAGVVAVPRTTTRGRPGLGLGERKFMQALCDWGVVVGGLLVILTMSVRDYAPVEILTSLAAVT
jgi:hypothetical protein